MRPLFSYGTLRPGEYFWPYIKDMVESTATAYVVGKLDRSGPYPDIDLTGEFRVVGTLLYPVEDTLEEFWHIVDRIEGAPNYYKRYSVKAFVQESARKPWTPVEAYVYSTKEY